MFNAKITQNKKMISVYCKNYTKNPQNYWCLTRKLHKTHKLLVFTVRITRNTQNYWYLTRKLHKIKKLLVFTVRIIRKTHKIIGV